MDYPFDLDYPLRKVSLFLVRLVELFIVSRRTRATRYCACVAYMAGASASTKNAMIPRGEGGFIDCRI